MIWSINPTVPSTSPILLNGLEKEDDDPQKEVEFNGIYRLSGGKLQLVHKGMNRPNGLAFSPDENYLYVANSDPAKSLWMRFEVQPDGSLANGTVFYDVTQETEEGLPDGMKVDKKGNLYCTGPGVSGSFPPTASISVRSSPRRSPPTVPGAGAMARRSTSPRKRDSIGFVWKQKGFVLEVLRAGPPKEPFHRKMRKIGARRVWKRRTGPGFPRASSRRAWRS